MLLFYKHCIYILCYFQSNFALKKITLDESRKSRSKEAVLREARLVF